MLLAAILLIIWCLVCSIDAVTAWKAVDLDDIVYGCFKLGRMDMNRGSGLNCDEQKDIV